MSSQPFDQSRDQSQQPSRDFNFLTFPLTGSQLIEASAGTGKTFSLALLYTRLVLGHGSEVGDGAGAGGGQTDVESTGFHRPLTPKEILVVTFTDAAAEELRDRIRARLVEAAVFFQDQETDRDDLDPLHILRASIPAAEWPGCAWRLKLAAESMDEASISTIHSWCNRMLVEHAFDTRGLFNRELVTDQSELLAEVVRDYWRKHFYPLSAAKVSLVLDCFASPEALQQRLQGLMGNHQAGLSYEGRPLAVPDFDACLNAHYEHQQAQEAEAARKAELEQTARRQWAEQQEEIEAYLWQLQPVLSGTQHDSAKPEKFTQLLQSIALWAKDEGKAPSKLKNFAEGAFSFKKGKEQAVKNFPAFTSLKAIYWADAHSDMGGEEGCEQNQVAVKEPDTDLRSALTAHALDWVSTQFDARMQRRAEMGFDDLLTQLADALNDAEHGPHLATTLAKAFPAAMIDEFQDTDPVQYQIFNRIYHLEENRKENLLVMIGDPKQAIYSFRGADIHTYLQARNATTGRHYTLKRNFRSSDGVVAACNHLFRHAEEHPLGAFRFKADGDNQVPYVVVDAKGRKEQLCFLGQPVAPMTLWPFEHDEDEPLSMSAYRQQAAEVAASQVTHWLNLAQQQQAGFAILTDQQTDGSNGPLNIDQPLKPKDIAILVRTGSEARLVREQLTKRQVASVYLSDRESVFASAEAVDLLHWLRAVAEPSDERLVRAALGSNTLELPLAQLADWREDELGWESQMLFFARLHRIWLQQGVLAMVRQLMDHYRLPARLLKKPEGERCLTNLLHLAEWLQQAAVEVKGEQALIRHLSEQIEFGDSQNILRLESDADLVQVITIHKSKGLEYPLVLLPFIGSWREIDGKTPQVNWRQGLGDSLRTYAEIAGKSRFGEAWDLANDERISEDMRLLYVALTRASHALWLGIGPLKSGNAKKPQIERSAMGYLLAGGDAAQTKTAEAVMEAYRALASGCGSIRLLDRTPDVLDNRLQQPEPPVLSPARVSPQLNALKGWWIASYSAIEYGAVAGMRTGADTNAHSGIAHSGVADPELAVEATASETRDEPLERAPLPEELDEKNVMHQFPAGASWGTFLHSLLEWAAIQRYRTQDGQLIKGFQAAALDDASRLEYLQRQCEFREIEHLASPLSDWLKVFLQMPWPLMSVSRSTTPESKPFSLAGLSPKACAVELEFLLESRSVNTQQLDQLVSRYTLDQQPRPAALPNQLNGMLKGFIDLVVEHEGRYYVVDWKSNKLGEDDTGYTHDAMVAAILKKRYDLQYCLYLLALHRQLKARLPDYDYDRHIGGSVYVFLRGWQGEASGLCFERPPKELIEALDRLFRGESVAIGFNSHESGEQGMLL